MEILMLNAQTKDQLIDYRDNNRFVKHEMGVLNEMIAAVEQRNIEKLSWFNQFGDSFRHIIMNVYAYRKGLEFGFTEVVLDKNGWLQRPEFLDREELIFGNGEKYSEHSKLTLGRGINQVWVYALSYHFGTAGGSEPLSVYNVPFKNRADALACGLRELKDLMITKIGHEDTTNYKQSVILATLRDIAKTEISRTQLSLF